MQEYALETPNLDGATVLAAKPGTGRVHQRHRHRGVRLLGDSVDINGADYARIEVTLNPGGS